ncbi:MAG: glycerol-3-phosphate 1-O-acyltransferase PlsY [Deltaproteobacteria bacterium]|nr:glycerol-3-phosphate 1-O-acyltransferase PlsY [Deltaproteobacteria bacterium]
MILEIGMIVGSYLIGSIPTGVIIARLFARVDIQTQGSRNIGATNVTRVVGKKAGLLTLLGDVAKGALPVWAMTAVVGADQAASQWWIAAVGAAAFTGHLFPLYLLGRGGKGVATALGVYLAAAPFVLAGCLAVFLAGAVTTRYVSMGSILGAVSLPILALWKYGAGPFFWMSCFICLSIILKHHENIRRILKGEESRWNEPRNETHIGGGS